MREQYPCAAGPLRNFYEKRSQMPRYFGDGGHLRATGTTAGGLVHLVLLHTSTYQPEAVRTKRDPFRGEFGNFGRGIFRNLGTNVEKSQMSVFRGF